MLSELTDLLCPEMPADEFIGPLPDASPDIDAFWEEFTATA